jgi:hypothetical protein
MPPACYFFFADDLRAGFFFADARVETFREADAFAAAAVFAGFRAAGFLAAGFFAATFFVGGFLTAGFFAVTLRTAVFLAAGFFAATVFFAAGLAAAFFLAGFFAADFVLLDFIALVPLPEHSPPETFGSTLIVHTEREPNSKDLYYNDTKNRAWAFTLLSKPPLLKRNFPVEGIEEFDRYREGAF